MSPPRASRKTIATTRKAYQNSVLAEVMILGLLTYDTSDHTCVGAAAG